MQKTRIGIFGATFDPVHFGHLIAAEYCRCELMLDIVLIIPAFRNPLKQDIAPAPPKIRLEMLEAVIGDNPHYKINDIELKRGGDSFMIDTVKSLIEEYSGIEVEFYLLLGADSAKDFIRWKDYKTLAKMCNIVLFNRPGADLERVADEFPIECATITIPMIEISSTTIRRRVMRGAPIRFLTPDPVIKIIDRDKLYR